MTTRTYTGVIDRSGWPTGLWDDEPQDKVQWTDQATGMPCLARRSRLGNWCGYVAVTSDHPAYGEDYHSVAVDVHGGLTFAGPCQDGPDAQTVCHIPEPGEPDDVWWLGFDCAHAYDLVPGIYAIRIDAGIPVWDGDVYRTLAYVQAECARLAAQLRP